MIHCSAFCAFIGEGASELLEEGVRNVDRHRSALMVDTGEGFQEFRGRVPRSSRAMGVFSLEPGETRLPAVHGFYTREEGYPRGEFSFLDASDGEVTVGRDVVGTRPLFFHGGSTLAVASDHRFLRGLGETRLLFPGESMRLNEGSSSIHALPRVEAEISEEEAGRTLGALLDDSVKRRVEGKKRVAVSFSGGLDSSLIAHCAVKYTDVVLCSVFSEGSRDERLVRSAAETLGLEILGIETRKNDVRRELEAMDLPFSPTWMDSSLWAIYSISGRAALNDGAELILLGQLADELFGGYMKYERAMLDEGSGSAARMMKEDVVGCGMRGLVRDEQACSRWVEPAFPFSDERIVAFGLATPPGLKICQGVRKAVLRDAARTLGLPEELVSAPKKAAQYSSGISKLVAKELQPF